MDQAGAKFITEEGELLEEAFGGEDNGDFGDNDE